MAEQVLTQCSTSTSLLTALAGRPGFQQASHAERLRLQVSLRMAPLSAADLGRIAQAVKLVKFSDDDEQAVMDQIAELVCSGQPAVVAKAARVSTQNFEALVHELLQSIVSAVKEHQLHVLLDHVLSLY